MSPPRSDEATPEAGAETRPRRGRIGLWLRGAVSLGLVFWILRGLDWSDFARTLRGAHMGFLALSLGLSPLLVLVSAWKWQILLRSRSLPQPLGALFRLYLLGYFFNNFLPTNVGGDVARSVALGRRTGRLAEATASVLLERLTGLFALVAMGLVGLAAGPRVLWTPRVSAVVGVVVAGFAVLVWLLLDTRLTGRLSRLRRVPFLPKVVKLQRALQDYRHSPGTLAASLLISALFYGLAALNIHWSLLAFRGSLTLGEAVWVTPVVLLIALLPISLGGIGLAEWAYLFSLGAFGIPTDVALSTALLLRAKALLLGAAGGLSSGFSGRRKNLETSP